MRLLFWFQRRRYGCELEPARLWGHTPKAFVAMAAMYAALDGKSSPLDPALRALVQVRVSQINWCSFCVDLNSANCLKRGASREKLTALPRFAESRLFDEREKAALAYTEAVTRSNRRTDAALIARLPLVLQTLQRLALKHGFSSDMCQCKKIPHSQNE